MAPLLHDEKDETSTKFDDKGKANILQKRLVIVFTKEQNAGVLVLDKNTEVNLPNVNITEEMVQNEILKLNVNKSCGPDKMHPQTLIELVDLVSKPLALLLNKTMDEECILQDWEMAYVSPIFKKEARNIAENYRPLSLTSKAFDDFPYESLLGNLKSYGINGKVLEWIKAFLSNCQQIVNFNGMKSDPATVLSRIPQR